MRSLQVGLVAIALLLASTGRAAAADVSIVGTRGPDLVWGPDDAGAFQTTPTYILGQPLTVKWDPSPNEATSAANRYEWRLDTNPVQTLQPIGQAAYAVALTQAWLTPGSHTVTSKLCSATACSPDSSYTFAIVYPTPLAPPNLRVQPTGPVAISLKQGEDLAHAYGQWGIGRNLTRSELGVVEARYVALFPGAPPEKYRLLAALDSLYAELAQ